MLVSYNNVVLQRVTAIWFFFNH